MSRIKQFGGNSTRDGVHLPFVNQAAPTNFQNNAVHQQLPWARSNLIRNMGTHWASIKKQGNFSWKAAWMKEDGFGPRHRGRLRQQGQTMTTVSPATLSRKFMRTGA